MMREILRQGFQTLGVPLREEAAERLEAYGALLEEKNRVMNLTAITGEEEIARQHFLDCGALLTVTDFANRNCIDVGSGAGFPGLVLKILEPTLTLTLLDSQGKRVEFQREVCERLGLAGVSCLQGRAEECAQLRGQFDIAVSRAVARLNLLAELCLPLVRRGGVFLAMKGPAAPEELDEARHALTLLGGAAAELRAYAVPGTDVQHNAVLVRKSGVTPPQYPRRWAKIKVSPL